MPKNLDKERWVHWPYCLERVAEGRYVLLNRRYKPLGDPGTAFVDDYSPWAFDLDLTPEQAGQMSFEHDQGTSRVYFYNDGTIPTDTRAFMSAYRQRLAVLKQIGGPDLAHIGGRS